MSNYNTSKDIKPLTSSLQTALEVKPTSTYSAPNNDNISSSNYEQVCRTYREEGGDQTAFQSKKE